MKWSELKTSGSEAYKKLDKLKPCLVLKRFILLVAIFYKWVTQHPILNKRLLQKIILYEMKWSELKTSESEA